MVTSCGCRVWFYDTPASLREQAARRSLGRPPGTGLAHFFSRHVQIQAGGDARKSEGCRETMARSRPGARFTSSHTVVAISGKKLSCLMGRDIGV